MTSEIVKQAVKEAEDSLKEKQIAEVKSIVLKTLERINELEKDIGKSKELTKELEEKRKLLRMDLDDLKDGRLDRVAERQDKDPKAKEIAVVLIIKEKETIIHDRTPWYWPYQVIWQVPTPPPYVYRPLDVCPTVYNSTSGGLNLGGTSINCSVAKQAAVGAYEVGEAVVNFR